MIATKRFFNQKETIVTDALDGLVALSGDNPLVRLNGYPHIKVIMRAEVDPGKVALVSGGGAGHEPAHAGFVGPGMLTAAVSGEIFASPSVEAVLAGIMAVTGEAGCLLIVKNYTGDRLNFGLAAERARLLGKQVETVFVADDIALPDAPQPRGVAGTLFVHKIAGHLAEAGADLATVAAAARAAAKDIWSLGISFQTCTLPGQPATAGLSADEGELGLGIHGEPGVEKIPLMRVPELIALMNERLIAAIGAREPGDSYALLINNLGAVPPIEMGVIAHEILRSDLAPLVEMVIGPAPLMTSLDMNGFSLSLLKIDDERRVALCSPCDPVPWPGVAVPTVINAHPLPAEVAKVNTSNIPASSEPTTERVLNALLVRLIEMEDELNVLDSQIGDGDTGSTFATAARSIQAAAPTFPFASRGELMLALGRLLGESMGGSSGVLLSIFCTAAGQAFSTDEAKDWAQALSQGQARLQEYGGANPGDRTMVDALVPGLSTLSTTADMTQAAAAAKAGAEGTATMQKANAGRAAYLNSESLDGVEDPGAVAIAAMFAAARDALS